jgi:Amt family ammonium transporter
MVAIGLGILWLGWNGFNGGDMYFGGAQASAGVINTNLATAVALLTWVIWDMLAGPQRKPTFLGAVNGGVTGLVAITPAAGFVNGLGAILVGFIASSVVWLSWNKLAKLKLFKKVDDAMGVFHTHGVAGLTGGLLVGLLADPNMTVYLPSADGKTAGFSTSGWIWGHHPKQLLLQAGAAITVIVWDAVMTYVILRILSLFIKLRLPDPVLETGDLAVHDEEAYPAEDLVSVGTARSAEPAPTPTSAPTPTAAQSVAEQVPD